jgi:hypothetical protein
MTMLGYRVAHGGWSLHCQVEQALAEGLPPLAHVDPGFEVLMELDIVKDNFIALDRTCTGSGFVLQTRDRELWLASRLAHYADYLRDRSRPQRRYLDGWRWTRETPEQWLKEWDMHHHFVRQYFSGRADFLEIDVPAGDGFDVLCPWLGVQAPGQPFPHQNSTEPCGRP